MTNPQPPDQRPPRLRDDEPIALLVAFIAFGAIFWWALSQGRGGWDVSSLIPGLASSPTPTTSPSPLATATLPLQPSPRATGSGQGSTNSPVVDGVPVPQPTLGTELAPVPQPTLTPTPSTGISPAPIKPLPAPVPGQAIAFPDVPQTYWAAPFIAALSAKGIIGGFPDGTFKPNQPVTRAQYAVQLQKAFTKPDRQSPRPFTDVPANSPWAIAVDKAVKANFMNGYPEGDFRPEQKISRTEAIVSMAQGLKLTQPADPEAILQAYGDRDQVPAWARGRVAAAIQSGIFPGDPASSKSLNPNQPATRADIAALVYKGLEASGAAK